MIPQISNRVKQAYVIKIGDRYFTNFGKKGQCQTAWSLAGAESFLDPQRLKLVMSKLDEKGKKYSVELITVQERSGLTLKDFYKTASQHQRIITNAEEIVKKIGFSSFARNISLYSAVLAFHEREFPSEFVEKICENVRGNHSLFKTNEKRGLKERLQALKNEKSLYVEWCEFDGGVPF